MHLFLVDSKGVASTKTRTNTMHYKNAASEIEDYRNLASRQISYSRGGGDGGHLRVSDPWLWLFFVLLYFIFIKVIF